MATMQDILKWQEEQRKNAETLAENTAQMKDLGKDGKHFSQATQKAANDDKIAQEEKRAKELNKNVKDLSEAIKTQIKLALKAGYGQKTAESIKEAKERQANETRSFGRNLLLGGAKGKEVEKGSWFHKAADYTGIESLKNFSPSGIIDKMLAKGEEKTARKKEKKEFVESALVNDKRSIALKNLKGEEYARKDAEDRFEQIKKKELEILKIEETIEKAKLAGYDPKKKDIAAREQAVGELAELDPRQKQKFANKEYAERAETRENNTKKTAAKSGIIPKTPEMGKTLLESEEKDQQWKDIGSTLAQSLEIQKEQLDQLKKMGGKGAGGGDNGGKGFGGLGGMGNIAKNLLAFSAALFITAKALQEFANVTWGGLFKGALAMTGLVIATNKLKNSDASKTLLAMGASLWLVSKALQNFASVEWESIIKGGVALGGLVLAAKMVDGAKSAIGLIALGGALFVVGKALQTFASVEWESIIKGGVALAGLVAVGSMAGGAAPELLLGAVGLGALGLAMWGISSSLKTFADLEWETIAKGFTAVIGLGVIGAIAGVAAPLLLAGAVAIGALGVALLPFAAAMALAGPAMDEFASGMERLSKISGDELLKIAAGVGALGVAMAAFGAGEAVAGLGNLVGKFLSLGGDSPVDQLIKIGQNGEGVMKAADGMQKIADSMQGFSKIPADAMKTVNDFPWVRATAFVAAGGQMSVTTPDKTTSMKVANASKSNEDARAANDSNAGGNTTTVVNAPTTVNNKGGGSSASSSRSPIRNQDSSMSKYLENRYA